MSLSAVSSIPAPTELTSSELLRLYRAILLPRLIEEKMLLLLRQGKVSKWFSGIGQEAIAVGCTLALQPHDYILPLHRNLGVFTARDMPLQRLFAQWQGKASGYTRGRDRSFHFGAMEHRIIGMISHLGAMLGVADGLALGSVLDADPNDDAIALVFSGDGGTSEGDFHEAVNVAAVWDLPVVFLIENNGYGLSTPSQHQFRCAHLVDKAKGYGIEGVQVDGNNLLEMHAAARDVFDRVRRERRPVILEALTFRMRGHEEASGVKYVPPELIAQWAKKDPVSNYERALLEQGVLSKSVMQSMRQELQAEIQTAWDAVEAEPELTPVAAVELADVYAVSHMNDMGDTGEPGSTRPLRFVDAISEGLRQGMERDDRIVLMGQDVADYGGVFKVTEGFLAQFGAARVRNTPLCESAILGTAMGLALRGRPAIVEMQFADFVSCGFNQIVNNLAKTHYRWGEALNVTVRMPTGAGVGAGPFHSQSNEAWFTHVPGLKVVYPSTPADAKGLIAACLLDPNPVMFFEHKLLYRSLEGEVPEGYYTLPLGKGRMVQEGRDATIVTYGAGVHWATRAAQELVVQNPNVSIEIIDLRTLLPWDRDMVFASVAKTSRCLVVHEDTMVGGFGGEIAASIGSECFDFLDAPVLRVGSLETPVPFNRGLEKQFLGAGRVLPALQALLAY